MDRIEHVRKYLAGFQAENRIIEFNVSSATVELAAKALGCEPAHIAKTLAFMVKDQPVFIVAAGHVRIDNHQFKHLFGTKPTMMTSMELEALTGYQFGGVCPFDLPDSVHVYLDTSLRDFDTVYPAAGNANSAVRLTPQELFTFAHALDWIQVCKTREP